MCDKKPMILVLAGPNGSGKSTITQYFDIVGSYTNADDMVASTGMSNQEAAVLADEKRYKSISLKEDFTFETVLSSRYKLDILEKAKSEGYFIKCIFVLTIDPSVNISRVAARVASGGHNVEEDKIRSRYYKSIENIKKLLVNYQHTVQFLIILLLRLISFLLQELWMPTNLSLSLI